MPRGYPGTRAPHGTITRYFGHGCRCDECKQAQQDYYRRTTTAMPRDKYLATIPEPKHGTEGRYINRGCRCDACREASRAARARRRQRSAA